MIEETIDVSTPTRQPIDVNIPVFNRQNYPNTFSVHFNDDELVGDSYITILPQTKYVYSLHLTPLKASNRITSVSFYNEKEGEFLYNLNIKILPPETIKITSISAVIGSTKSEIIQLENPMDSPAVFKVENDNPTNFIIVIPNNNPIITVQPKDTMLIEVRFIPTSISTKTFANVTFSSRLLGDFTYSFRGYGKPPLPSKPTVIKLMIQVSSSGQIKFTNPFPFPSEFEVILQTETDFFSILSKRKIFTLYEYEEESHVIFSFYPQIEHQKQTEWKQLKFAKLVVYLQDI